MKKLILILAIIFTSGTFCSYAQHSDTLNPVADVLVYTWGGGQGGNAYLKFDISSLPENIVVSNAKLEVNVFARVLPWDDDVKFINLNNQTWVEGDNGDMLWNSIKSDTIIQLNNFAPVLGWTSSTNIAPILLRDYNQSHSFCTILLKDPDDGTMGPQSGVPATDLNDSIVVGNIIGGFNGYIMFRPHEYSDQSKIPMFIIDYGIAPDITNQPDSVTICNGTQATFSVTATGDSLEYQWQKNGSDINGATLNTFIINTATSSDDGNYRCIVSNSFGADTSNVATLTVSSISITLSSIEPSVCSACDGSISANIIGGTPPYSYLWSTPPEQTTQTAVDLCAGSYCVTVTDLYGCTENACTILSDPAKNTIALTCSDDTICKNDFITFIDSSGGIFNNVFYINGVPVQSGPSNTFITCNLNDGDSVAVMGTDVLGCSDFSDYITITVFSLPAKFDVTGGGSYCAGDTGLPVGLSGSEIGIDYLLYCDSNSVGITIAGTGGPINFGNQTDSCCYTIIAVNPTTLCSNTMNGNACISMVFIPVNVIATPDTICSGNCSGLTVTANGGCSPYNYLWSFGATSSTVYICPSSSSTYNVTATDCNGCSNSGSISVIVEVCPGISEDNNVEFVQLLPNPFSNYAQILSDKYLNDAVLKVYNMLGNEVRCIKDISGNSISVYRQDLPNGMYFYRLSEKNNTISSGKFILN